MFSDETVDSVCVQSLWRQSQHSEQDSRSCQTKQLRSADAEAQSVITSFSGTQTQFEDKDEHTLYEPNPKELDKPELKHFLDRVVESVIRELVKNARSHAFDGFKVSWEDHSDLVSCLHCLEHPSAKERGLHVTCISWNCTGSVVSCGFGRIDDGDWSTEKSFVCTWNLNRKGLSPTHADMVIDVPTAVTALCCHPDQPALIAGGLYSGEVVVWDTSRTQDTVLAQTSILADSHREPVYKVSWMTLQKKGVFGILSACSGGRILLWNLDQSSLILSTGYALILQQVPHSNSAGFKTKGSSNIGVTALARSFWDSDTFLVGSEGGWLLRCSFSSQKLAMVASEGQSVSLRAPAVFSFRKHSGPIHSIHCSPFHRNLFVSAGTDGLAHIHSLLQANPVLSVRVSDSYIFQVQWSPSRPLVFAAASSQGEVQIFDLGHGSLKPTATIEKGGSGQAATCLAFNSQNTHLLAVGKTDGTASIWQLSGDLTEQGPREISQLDHIAKQVAE
ncbi:cytoplasmic dynein 2 intermediate chain 2 [Boleophthalmus pectinirostris]|uniref:cytoplasmic dynein 2 intermediate chain 2 n=1 Tax=Boleophthalmus pectinirostris TaxID=150288 RepID=UPI000A1C1D2F|nr:cytoplasmic dynein 2 intermediate chain 2 [Boleophthalmus pectinirostris]